jgi:cobalt-zinc-cadmium efflux system outer membrane protein
MVIWPTAEAQTAPRVESARGQIVGTVATGGNYLSQAQAGDQESRATDVPQTTQPWIEPRPLGRELGTYRPPHEGTNTLTQPSAAVDPDGTLTLRQALALALADNPELAVYSWEVRAGEARLLQAGLRPNPVVTLEPHDLTGSGDYRDAGRSEITLQLGLLIELGGKRAARLRAAALDRDLSGWDYETKRIEVFSQTSMHFLDVLREQQQLALAQETTLLAQQVVDTVAARVKVGATYAEEATKAEVALALVEIERDQIERALLVARQRLAANWGSTEPCFERVEGELDSVAPIPAWEELSQQLAQNPELARWATEISRREAALELERALATPDITAGGGYRRTAATGDNSLVLGVSMPVPWFNQNQGNIKAAEYQLAKTQVEERATEVRLVTRLNQAYQALAGAEAEISALKQRVLPGAQGVFEAVSEHYREARYSYLEVLDAQRTLFAARSQLLHSFTNYHRAVLAIERLIGAPLPAPTDKP